MNKKAALQKIAEEIEKCKTCKINKIGKAVPGEGNANAIIVFIGEAPGKEEAKTGKPFVGRSGKLLRQAIKNIGLNENKIFITSPIKYLPRHKITKADIIHGRIHLLKQLKIINPKIVVLLGNVACKAVLEEPISIKKNHGKILKKNDKHYFISYHPAAAVRFAKVKELFLNDFKKLKKLFN